MGINLTTAQRERVAQLFKCGNGINEIVCQTGHCKETVRMTLVKAGLWTPKVSVAKIAKDNGCSVYINLRNRHSGIPDYLI